MNSEKSQVLDKRAMSVFNINEDNGNKLSAFKNGSKMRSESKRSSGPSNSSQKNQTQAFGLRRQNKIEDYK